MSNSASRSAPRYPGVDAAVFEQLPEGLDMATIVRAHDIRGRYRRPCFDSDGRPTGKFDEMVQSTRGHHTHISKGYVLVALVK